MSNQDLLFCSTCGASFRRNEHLRRHVATHSSSRPFRCNACESSFKRRYVCGIQILLLERCQLCQLCHVLTAALSDVLRKHFRTCPRRLAQDIELPGRLPVGKKLSSCDQCARLKKACDSAVPCGKCSSKGRECTYDRHRHSSSDRGTTEVARGSSSDAEFGSDLNYDFADDMELPSSLPTIENDNTDWVDWDWNSNIVSYPPQEVSTGTHSQNRNVLENLGFIQQPHASRPAPIRQSPVSQRSFEYLLHFTRASGLRSTLNYKRQRISQLTPTSSGVGSSENSREFSVPTNSELDASGRHLSSYHEQQDTRFNVSLLIEYLNDPFFAQTKAILDCFRVSRIRSSQNILRSDNDAERSDERCLHFFSPPNLRRFVRMFWDEWYPHCAIIHRPTFDIIRAPAILVVPMVLIGASMSSTSLDRAMAKEWLQFAEEIVFSNPILSSEAMEREPADVDISPLNVVQAAYFVCILMNWEGSDTMKRRVRHHHFAALVSAVREIGLSSANHFPSDHVNGENFQWRNFIKREEMIRTFTYVFLLDTAFVIFNNTPPRMVLHEMDLEMTTCEKCFQAENAVDCYKRWQSHVSKQIAAAPMTPLLLAEAISVIMRETFEGQAVRFQNMTILNLFTLVAGLHTVVFQQRSLYEYLPISLLPIRYALKRWQAAWDTQQASVADEAIRDSWQDTGFIAHAQEFGWLVEARLDALESPKQTGTEITSAFKTLTPSPGRLDDTSMSVVADLIRSLSLSCQ